MIANIFEGVKEVRKIKKGLVKIINLELANKKKMCYYGVRAKRSEKRVSLSFFIYKVGKKDGKRWNSDLVLIFIMEK